MTGPTDSDRHKGGNVRYFTLVMLLVIGFESLACAYDLTVPPSVPQTPNVVDASNSDTVNSQLGTVIGGGMLAIALLLCGLWFIRKRKMSSTNL